MKWIISKLLYSKFLTSWDYNRTVRVALYHEIWQAHSGGGTTYLLNLVDGLNSKTDLRVVLLLCESGLKNSFLVEKLKEKEADGLSFRLVDISDYAAIRNPYKIIDSIQSEVSFENVDVVHHTDGGAWGIIAGKMQNPSLKTLVTYHHVLEKAWMKYAVQKNKCVANLVDKAIGVSNVVRNKLVENYEFKADKLRTIYNGVTPQKSFVTKKELCESYNIPESVFIIGFTGRLEPEKNVIQLLRLLKSDSDYWGFIVGDGTEAFELKSYCEKEKITNVCFTGFLENASSVTGGFDALCLPSFSESFGLVLVDAMMACVSTLGSDRDGIREVLGDGEYGILFDPESLEDLSAKVRHLKENATYYAEMKLAARQYAEENFTSDRMVEKTSDLYKEIVQNTELSDMTDDSPESLLKVEQDRFFENLRGLSLWRFWLTKLRYLYFG